MSDYRLSSEEIAYQNATKLGLGPEDFQAPEADVISGDSTGSEIEAQIPEGLSDVQQQGYEDYLKHGADALEQE